MSASVPAGETLDEKIARLERARADREAKLEESAKARRAEELEIEERFTADLGARGVKFQIVSTEIGNFAVKLPDFVTFKRFNAKAENIAPEDVMQLVLAHLIHPSRETATVLLRDHTGIAYKLASAMQDMHQAKGETRQGKS